MSRYKLGFISDYDIFEHVKNTIEKYRKTINLKDFNSNIIDPIKLTFDALIYQKKMNDLILDECIRQIDKSNSNVIGYFHQNIFKYVKGGWEVPRSGYDLVNEKKHIYVEIKNKHNTMNSSSSQKTYIKMQDTILEDDQATCYLAEVISKTPGDHNWGIKVDGKRMSNKHIRRISMDAFYALVFEDPLAFYKLCSTLPKIISDVLKKTNVGELQNTVLEELTAINKDLEKSLFLLAFKEYEGFKDLKNE